MWLQHNASSELKLLGEPWRAANLERDAATATKTAEFTEMLCQLDGRLDKLLPSCWMRHGYLFSLMDALRCEYAVAYIGFYNQKNKFVEAGPSRDQFQFWLDEDTTVRMVQEYCTRESLGSQEQPHNTVSEYSRETKTRRNRECEGGIEACEYYPFDVNSLAPVSSSAEAEPVPPDDPLPPAASEDGSSNGGGARLLD